MNHSGLVQSKRIPLFHVNFARDLMGQHKYGRKYLLQILSKNYTKVTASVRSVASYRGHFIQTSTLNLGAVELVECLTSVQKVTGSNPSRAKTENLNLRRPSLDQCPCILLYM